MIVVLAITTIITGTIILDVLDQGGLSFGLAAVRSTAGAKAATMSLEANCAGSYLKGITVNQSDILLTFAGCTPSAIEIANDVEQGLCTMTPNNDERIDCSGLNYSIKII